MVEEAAKAVAIDKDSSLPQLSAAKEVENSCDRDEKDCGEEDEIIREMQENEEISPAMMSTLLKEIENADKMLDTLESQAELFLKKIDQLLLETTIGQNAEQEN